MASVGELFISLGVKGAEKTVGAITTVKDGLKGIASTSLETKAAIIAAIYAIERLFQASGQRGTALENFSQLTGMATKTVQQYQWAAQQVGVSNEAVTGTFVTLQKKMTDTLLGKGAPEGLGMLARTLGRNITTEEVADWQKNPEKELQVLQQYAALEKNAALKNKVLESMGAGQEIIPALDRQAFSPENLKKAPTYSDSQISNLDKANVGWKNLGTTIEMMFGKINAKHGLEFVKDIQMLLPPIEKVIEALIQFAEKIHLFDKFKTVLKDIVKIIDFIGTGIEKINNSKTLAAVMKDPAKEFNKILPDQKNNPIENTAAGGLRMFFLDIMKAFMDTRGIGPDVGEAMYSYERESKDKSIIKNPMGKSITPARKGPVAPAITPKAPALSNSLNTQNINVNQTMTFQNSDSNPKEAAHAFKRDVQSAARQLSSLGQGS